MRASAFFVLALLGGMFWAAGCDTSFDLYGEADLYYSVFGYLDAATGTQWVRIEPLQDSVFIGSGEIDVRVSTQNVQTGEEALWHHVPVHLPAGHTIHSFWTDGEIEPGATYRFTASGRKGTTTAEVTIPRNAPAVTLSGTRRSPPLTVTVRNVHRLGALNAVYSSGRVISYLPDTTHLAGGAVRVRIPNISIGGRVSFPLQVEVANVSEDWPEYDFPVWNPGDPTPPQPPVPGLDSNVENGLGYLGGAVTKTVDVPM